MWEVQIFNERPGAWVSGPVFEELFVLAEVIMNIITTLFTIKVLTVEFAPIFPVIITFFTIVTTFRLREIVNIGGGTVRVVDLVFTNLVPLCCNFGRCLARQNVFVPTLTMMVLCVLLLFVLVVASCRRAGFRSITTIIITSCFIP